MVQVSHVTDVSGLSPLLAAELVLNNPAEKDKFQRIVKQVRSRGFRLFFAGTCAVLLTFFKSFLAIIYIVRL